MSPSRATPGMEIARRSWATTVGPFAHINVRAANSIQRHGAFPKPIQARGSMVIRGRSVERAKPIQQVFCSRGRDGQNGKSIPPFDHRQLLFVVRRAQLIKAEEFAKFAKKTKSSTVPSRLIWTGFGVEILGGGIKLGWVD